MKLWLLNESGLCVEGSGKRAHVQMFFSSNGKCTQLEIILGEGEVQTLSVIAPSPLLLVPSQDLGDAGLDINTG